MQTEKALSAVNVSVSVSPAFYRDYYTYLCDALELLNLRLLKELRSNGAPKSNMQGFFVTEEEVAALLNGLLDAGGTAPAAETAALDALIADKVAAIAQQLGATPGRAGFPLLRLAETFGLEGPETEILVMALAPEIDRRYAKIYAYFNDDLTRKAPSVRLALGLLGNGIRDRLGALDIFSPQAPLLYFDLIRFTETPEDFLLYRGFTLEERIKRLLLGADGLPGSLGDIVRVDYPAPASGGPEVQAKITRILAKMEDRDTGRPVFWLYGKAPEQKRAVVNSVCAANGIPLLTVPLADLLDEPDQRSVLKGVFREAALRSAAVLFTGGELLTGEEEHSRSLRRLVLRMIGAMSWITFITAEKLWLPDEKPDRCGWYPFECHLPGPAARKEIWLDAVGGGAITEAEAEALAARFRLGEGRIRNAVLYAGQVLDGEEPLADRLFRACRLQSNNRLGLYAVKMKCGHSWDDIVLPADKLTQLQEIRGYIEHRHTVYRQWGFEEKLAPGRGLNILFSGPSGTGKTMAAAIIAADLKMDVYRIDLSAVVSKYIGETEKNLSRIFREAESADVILFFDEADALFGKRSEVKDAHDRYANVEIGYLLQKLEEHEGVVILASNLAKNIDEAFQRRMHFIVEFPFPGEELRQRIWHRVFPPQAPLEDGLDFELIATRYTLAGGNISNIALHAAFLAAAGAGRIGVEQIDQAIKREYQKMGCTRPPGFPPPERPGDPL